MGKPFKESTVGKMLLGAASLVSPALGGVLSGAISASDAISAITKSSISDEDKIKSDSWLSKNVRPMILIWCIVVFTIAGIIDSVETIPFQISSLWNDTFENVMMAVVLAYFGGRTAEKAANCLIRNNGKSNSSENSKE
jgi:hypothetical protein